MPTDIRLRRQHCLSTTTLLKLIDNFKCFKMYYIPRENNTRAYILSKLISTKKTEHLKTVIQETLQTPTIDTKEVMVGEKKELD